MSEVEQEQFFELVNQRCEAIADIWYRAIAHTSFVPHPASEIRRVLLDLTRRSVMLLFMQELDREAAQEIGATLPRLNYTPPESLSRTIETLSAQIPQELPSAELIRLQPRLSLLLGEIAAGFFRQARNTILADQEEIRYALLLERRRAEHALAQARDQALETARLKSDFLATMSHELRTPLNSIIGFTNITLQEHQGPLNEQQRSNLERVSRNSQTLLELINSVLDMSKIDAGRMQLADEPVQIVTVVESAVANIEALASSKQLDITVFRPEGSLPYVRGDATRLQQVLMNLLSNAVKFTSAPGSITVILEYGYAAALTTAAPPYGDVLADRWIAMSVQDTGIGIAPEDLERIWGEFYQVDSSTTRKYSGTGLGLAIAKRLTMMMGGTVGVRSTLGSGSTFTIWLPVERADEQAKSSLERNS
ncbi:MAG TPA: HAMP domain-containing sensor histidine kinase [Herpetosiphonaceae bacterium]